MAYDSRVVRQTDILGVMLVVIALWSSWLVVDNEGTLNIDPHSSRVGDGVLNVGLGRSPLVLLVLPGFLRARNGACHLRRHGLRGFACA